MGFTASSTGFSRLKITEEVSNEKLSQIPELLIQHSFKDIDEIAVERSFGWVNFDDMLDTSWQESPPEKAHYFCFSLRIDTRRIPAGVMKKHLMLALKEEEQRNKEQGRKFISRERKKELKEQVHLRLMSRFLPIPAEFNIIWNTEKNMIYLASTQEKIIDLFMEYFTKSFNLHLELLTPYSLAAHLLGDTALNSLDYLSASSFA
ncbi:recombination-associated protein RdgC [Desulfovibrio litoralis]|uniref:Putative exonuclease, RdgC n=1 Tax=Desulfovibrio litoralis DSM 11393 TaxID=1121455 RepID=A0A1M7RXW3_9BACT|nr:recombination-associated protein RdgC [Desulfovibrio litoralis]SHN50902.1 Putative exonuclease, RdgC [Desulfovibrio litoralis DSM 11393]